MVKQMPSASDVWRKIPEPMMAPRTVMQSKKGLHVFRMTVGTDIYGDKLYIVETRDILGMATEFTQDNTASFSDRVEAKAFYTAAQNKAKAEYMRLKRKQQNRKEI